jgi:hypothetical protein
VVEQRRLERRQVEQRVELLRYHMQQDLGMRLRMQVQAKVIATTQAV